MLMADIAEGETGDAGKVREWLSRAVRAPRDPVWTADGYVSETWAPVSPISGHLDAFEWKVPVEALSPPVEDEEPEAAPAPMIESFAAPVAAAAAAAESTGDTQVEPEPEAIDVTPPEAAATADEPVPEPAPETTAPAVPVPAEAEADATPDERAGEPEAESSEEAAAAGTGDAATPLPADMSELDEEAALESAEETISEFVDEKASGAVAPTVAPIVEGAGAEGVGEDADEAPEKAQPFLMGHAPDDPGPLPPDEGDDRPKKRFGLF